MKMLFLIPFISALASLNSCSCSGHEKAAIHITGSASTSKTLIVYLTRTKNTEAVARMIHQRVSGDLVALELMNPYPQNYQQHVDQVAEENKTGYLPELKTVIDSIDNYEVIFIGFPTWGMQLPPPIKTFLKQYNLGGKTIVPFNTNAGYGVGSGFETIRKLCADSKVLKGFSVEGGKEKDGILFVMKGDKEIQVKMQVDQWLQILQL